MTATQMLANLTHEVPSAAATACAAFLEKEETAIREGHERGADGLVTAQARAGLFDTLFAALAGPHPDLAVVAIGAYGRGALNPLVPVRFLVLTSGSGNAAPATLLETLALLGLKPGLPAGPPESFPADDFALATALIDARLVHGPQELFDKLAARAGEVVRGEKFAARLARETSARHQRSSGTVFLQEPNVKESCGGLDDYHTMRWLLASALGSPDTSGPDAAECLSAAVLAEIRASLSFLHRVRNELHYHTGAPTDRLTLRLQGIVATAFGYPQQDILRRTEELMRDYYGHSLALYQHAAGLAQRLTAPLAEEPVAARALNDEGDVVVSFGRFDGFIAANGVLEAADSVFENDSNRLMRAYLHCQVRHLAPGPGLHQAVMDYLPRIDRAFRFSRANAGTFQAILEHKGEVAAPLRLMHRDGVLGRYVPEFGLLDRLVQHEFFHRYTADEHTLRCFDELDRLLSENRPDRAVFAHLYRQIADPFAFHTAVLLHDTGRAENTSEHADGSVQFAARVCERLRIQGPRRGLILFLVENHLAFWRAATSRNLEDPEVIAEFAAIVKNRENLDTLLLFTYCDSNGTSPDSWNSWRQSLMLQLHGATARFLEGGGRDAYESSLETDRLGLREEVTALMRTDRHEEIVRHFDLMPAAAFHFRDARHIVAQIRTIRQFLQAKSGRATAPFAIKWLDYPGKGYTELILATNDRPMLLEKLCCALAACEINILSADFFTRADSIVVEVFRVGTPDHEPVADPALRESFLDCFETILTAEKYEPTRYLHHLRQEAAPNPAIPPEASVSNTRHPACTTAEIQTADRIGILHDVFAAINRLGLSTAHARICTEKGAARDTLYITAPDGTKVTDASVLEALEQSLAEIVGCGKSC